MKLEELRDYYGNFSRMARKLDIGISTYQYWQRIGYIPMKSQLLIQHRTNSLFLVDEDDAKVKKNT